MDINLPLKARAFVKHLTKQQITPEEGQLLIQDSSRWTTLEFIASSSSDDLLSDFPRDEVEAIRSTIKRILSERQ